MTDRWKEVPFDQKLYQNVDEAVLSKANAALENCYQNAAGGLTRFPGSKSFATLSGSKTYLHEWRGNLMAATDEGRVYRIDQDGAAEDVTGVPISGGRRVVFARTEDELLMAAGGPIIRYAGRDTAANAATEVLSENAPESTHVAFVDGYVIAIEPYSGRFYHSNAGVYRTWDPIDVFTAEGKPDDLNAVIVTDYRELLLAGEDSIEQFDRLASSTTPFFRRWMNGEGLYAPYTLIAADNAAYGVNKDREFVRFAGQGSSSRSDDVQSKFEDVSDWSEAWAAEMHLKGQKFIVLQIPHATNPYGTDGITALYDFRGQRWFNLYDYSAGLPRRWRPWSYYALWGRHFIGVPGAVEEILLTRFSSPDGIQRMLVRSGHIDAWGESRVNNFAVRLKRGVVGSNDEAPRIGVRCNRDNLGFGKWVYRDLGRAGDRSMVVDFGGFGCAETFQFEVQITDDATTELVWAKADVTPLRK